MVNASVAAPTRNEPVPLTDGQRRQLWRVFSAWTGDASVADDLTQETLVEAWRSTHRPEQEPDLTRWLFGVARNVLRRHRREQGREARWSLDLADDDRAFALASESLDLDAELEREDIVTLLDAALARLPAESRRALLLRYVDGLPQREIAARLGLNEKALEGKLHRGKRALHRYLVTDGHEAARAFGLVAAGDDWQVTNLWCDCCGRQRLLGRWAEGGGLRLDCPSCALLDGRRSCHTEVGGYETAGMRSFGAASNRVMARYHDWSKLGLPVLHSCASCGNRVQITRVDSGWSSYPEFWLRCTGCPEVRFISSMGITGGHPHFRAWMKREGRVGIDPFTPIIERDGRDALHLRWTSLTSTSTYEAIRDSETLRYLLIARNGQSVQVDEPGEPLST